jgi:ribosomal protein S27E
MHLTCPECKNEVSLLSYPTLKPEDVVECGMCGITLQVTEMDEDKISAEIVDEGK